MKTIFCSVVLSISPLLMASDFSSFDDARRSARELLYSSFSQRPYAEPLPPAQMKRTEEERIEGPYGPFTFFWKEPTAYPRAHTSPEASEVYRISLTADPFEWKEGPADRRQQLVTSFLYFLERKLADRRTMVFRDSKVGQLPDVVPNVFKGTALLTYALHAETVLNVPVVILLKSLLHVARAKKRNDGWAHVNAWPYASHFKLRESCPQSATVLFDAVIVATTNSNLSYDDKLDILNLVYLASTQPRNLKAIAKTWPNFSHISHVYGPLPEVTKRARAAINATTQQQKSTAASCRLSIFSPDEE